MKQNSCTKVYRLVLIPHINSHKAYGEITTISHNIYYGVIGWEIVKAWPTVCAHQQHNAVYEYN